MATKSYSQGTIMATSEKQQVFVVSPSQGQVLTGGHPGYGPGFSCGNILICIVDAVVQVWITTMGFVAVSEIADSSYDLMTPQAWMSVAWAIFSVFVVHVTVHCLSWACCPVREGASQGCFKRVHYPVIYQVIAMVGWVIVAAFLTQFYIHYNNDRPASHFVGFNSLMFVFIIVSLFTVTPFWYQTWSSCLCCIGVKQHNSSGDCAQSGCGQFCCPVSDGRGVYGNPGAYAQGQMVAMQVQNA